MNGKASNSASAAATLEPHAVGKQQPQLDVDTTSSSRHSSESATTSTGISSANDRSNSVSVSSQSSSDPELKIADLSISASSNGGAAPSPTGNGGGASSNSQKRYERNHPRNNNPGNANMPNGAGRGSQVAAQQVPQQRGAGPAMYAANPYMPDASNSAAAAAYAPLSPMGSAPPSKYYSLDVECVAIGPGHNDRAVAQVCGLSPLYPVVKLMPTL